MAASYGYQQASERILVMRSGEEGDGTEGEEAAQRPWACTGRHALALRAAAAGALVAIVVAGRGATVGVFTETDRTFGVGFVGRAEKLRGPLRIEETRVPGGSCGNSPMLNDFSSKAGMEAAGWWFNWTDAASFKPEPYGAFAPTDSYWGYAREGSGAISLRVRGEGILSLDFGNLLGTQGSEVSLFHNTERIATAGPSQISKVVKIPFQDEDAMIIVQGRQGVIVLKHIRFECGGEATTGATTITTTTTTTAAPVTRVSEGAADTKGPKEGEEALLLDALAGVAAAGAGAQRIIHEPGGGLALRPIPGAEEQTGSAQLRANGSLDGSDDGVADGVAAAMEAAAFAAAAASRVSLYCFALMLPYGYEPRLLMAQQRKRVGLFACDAHDIFTNSSTLLDTGKRVQLGVKVVPVTLSVPLGGKWHTALNTPVFNRIWTEVRESGVQLQHDWIVKVDPDTVWFPQRLRTTLINNITAQVFPMRQRRLTQQGEDCKTCRLPQGGTCQEHVQWVQKHKNASCREALELTSRLPPLDCGCSCSMVEACDLRSDPAWKKDGGVLEGDYTSFKPIVYLNNCIFGLHGPIEVLSSGALNAYVGGLEVCNFLLQEPWGEDKFMDRCMLALGVTRVNVFSLLSEDACGEEPTPCGAKQVAFHPFKSEDKYFECWESAANSGATGRSLGNDLLGALDLTQ
mmetsp:Transcript_33007/g.99715  ORF Transcript_33007/g.99715 Transcript_33007/m.99715 type:complete len:688 (-) Transcript_33007:33-2096(-)